MAAYLSKNYKSSLISPVSNFRLEILFLRDDDIQEYVQDGIAFAADRTDENFHYF